MVCGQLDNNVVSCSDAEDCAFKRSGKDYSDIAKVYDRR